MTGVSFTLDDVPVTEALARLQAAAGNPVAAYNAIGAYFVFSSQRNIELERAPDGKPWPRLSPRTAEKRIGRNRKRGFMHMLRVKPELGLFSSISYRALTGGVEWGSHLKYARIHQLGGVVDQPARQATVSIKNIRKKGNRFARLGAKGSSQRLAMIKGHQVHIPARPYLGVSAQDRDEAANIIADHLREASGVKS